jgi:hypothetical protein
MGFRIALSGTGPPNQVGFGAWKKLISPFSGENPPCDIPFFLYQEPPVKLAFASNALDLSGPALYSKPKRGPRNGDQIL